MDLLFRLDIHSMSLIRRKLLQLLTEYANNSQPEAQKTLNKTRFSEALITNIN